MKKTLAFILAVSMALCMLTGCSGQEKTKTPDFSVGVTTETAYTSEFSSLSFTLPEGWDFATQEELETMMGAGSEAIYGEDPSAAVKYSLASTVYDMMAYSADGASNIIVMYENLARYPGGTKLTEEEYLQLMSDQLTSMDGYDYTIGDTSSVTLGSYDYTSLVAQLAAGEQSINQQYCVRRVGSYILAICFTGIDTDIVSVLGSYFG